MCKTQTTAASLLRLFIWLTCATLTAACNDGGPANEPASGAALPATVEDIYGDTSAELSGDTLEAPEQPEFHIRAGPSTLFFDWKPLNDQKFARLYRQDAQLGGETLVYETDDAWISSLQLPSRTPQTAWHRQQYRLELCSVDDCVSSARLSLAGLASDTRQILTPAVFLRGERYAEQFAVNHDATLAVISLPLEGVLELRTRNGTRWTVTQRLRLEDLPISASRSTYLSVSDNGNTIAVLINDTENQSQSEVRILERLGEAWFQTTSLSLTPYSRNRQVDNSLPDYPDTASGHRKSSILLSADGSEMLLQNAGKLYISHTAGSGWSTPRLLSGAASGDPEQGSEGQPRLLSSSVNSRFDRIVALLQQDAALYLQSWTADDETDSWIQSLRLPVNDFAVGHEVDMQLDSSGNQLLIAGWETNNTAERSPVMWRYALESESASASPAPLTLTYRDSLRAPPATQAAARLVFTADESLTLAALGWRLAERSVSAELPDALISTWQYHASSRQWLSALELPEAIPTLAKQAFAGQIQLSGDGATLMMTMDNPGLPAVGGALMVLQ